MITLNYDIVHMVIFSHKGTQSNIQIKNREVSVKALNFFPPFFWANAAVITKW